MSRLAVILELNAPEYERVAEAVRGFGYMPAPTFPRNHKSLGPRDLVVCYVVPLAEATIVRAARAIRKYTRDDTPILMVGRHDQQFPLPKLLRAKIFTAEPMIHDIDRALKQLQAGKLEARATT